MTAWESYSFYGKAAIVLQDMMDEEPRGSRREVLVALLEVFDDRIERLQGEMSEAMERVPEPESLLWGDGRDRRLYYFKLGVTNSLRRSRQLESLAHLYRLKGVNYDVEGSLSPCLAGMSASGNGRCDADRAASANGAW